jgi:hypothetical protein
MKKILLLSAILFGAVCGASAQYYYNNTNANPNAPAPKLGFGLSSGAATGPVSGYFPEAGALILSLELPIKKSPVSVVFQTGYTFYVSQGGYGVGYDGGGFGYDTYYSGQVASFIPLEAGLKAYVAPHFFLEGQAGASFNVNYYTSNYTNNETAFIYDLGAGYTFPLGFSRNATTDLSLVYENRPEAGGGYSQVALRAVFNFPLIK